MAFHIWPAGSCAALDFTKMWCTAGCGLCGAGKKTRPPPLDKTDKAAILDTDIKTGALGGIPG